MFEIATTRILHSPETSTELRPWVWPLPNLNGFSPKILEDAHDIDPDRRDIVIGYEPYVALPRFLPVFAVRDGAVTYGGKTSNGFTVCLDHAGGWSTQYGGLEHMFVNATDRFRKRRKERVRAGDVLGYIGIASPRVRFELSRYSEEDGSEPVCPIQRMRRWVLLPWTETPRTPSSQPQDQDRVAA
jgi:murein DD-endopeptidase MepM/ murein hydrolase activator NlpD